MKRAILIATGTVGGLGAVFAITPPTFTATTSSPLALLGGSPTTAAPVSNTASISAVATTASQSAKPSKTTSSKTAAKKSSTAPAAPNQPEATQTPTQPAAPNQPAATPTPTQPAAPAAPAAPTKAAPTAVSGTFTGDVERIRYGNVQVKITVVNGKITDAQAVQAPTGQNDRWTQMAVPILREQTLHAQSAAINGASGASFTSFGWQKSLISALAKAGL